MDEMQLEIAKALDPRDPTPWLYDAIRKQSINRPVEALKDLQTSIQLNDNRAIYRSRLLLDEDLSTRSASLGRIYNDFEFQHIALVEGYNSINADSSNHSAHRLLADTYASKPRHQIARVSELLQAQLFQPLNLTPIQAHLAETKTSFFEGAGPGTLSFNEFNPLFTRNRVSIQASGFNGSNKTWGNELTGSGIFDQLSLSISDFHYQTDGFRENNDDYQDIFDLFIQGSLSQNTGMQVEYRNSQRESGDLSQNFDDVFSTDQRDTDDLIKKRIGLHHNFSSQFELVASAIHLDRRFERNSTFSTLPGTRKDIIDSRLYEVRTDFRRNRLGLITGFIHMEGTLLEDFFVSFFGSQIPIIDNEEENFLKQGAYAYTNLEISESANVLIGLSADALKVGSQIEKKQWNPKLGLTLRPLSNTTLRLAGFRVLSSRYELFQTIEPTQVSGFNQFFDDLDASDVKAYGMAIDQKFTNQLYCGLELLKRDLKVPQFNIASNAKADFFDWSEVTGSTYIYWAPFNVLSFRVEYQYEHFNRRENPIESSIVDIDTHRIPLSIHYFHPHGVTLKLGATYFFQEGEFSSTGSGSNFSDNDNFWIIDAEVSYRLPKRWGILSIGIKNLLDEEFSYQDTDPSNPTAAPGFLGYGKITFSF
ncbi:MAG: TonB-dependent receptor [Desulfobacteraceae bacterium]